MSNGSGANENDGWVACGLAKVFGHSWRTTLGGFFETACIVALAIFSLPEEVLTKPKFYIPATIGVLLKSYKDSRTKDKGAPPVAKFDPTNTTKP